MNKLGKAIIALLILCILGLTAYTLKYKVSQNKNSYKAEDELKDDISSIEVQSDPLIEDGIGLNYIGDGRNENLTNNIRNSINEQIKDKKGFYSIGFWDLDTESKVMVNSKKTNAASVIKIFIMVEAYNQIDKEILKENEVITLEDNMKVEGSGSLFKEKSGRGYKISELLDLMIIESDNTATNILIDKLGMDNINNTIKEFGYTDTALNRKMMDKAKIDGGVDNYTSIIDLNNMLYKIYNNECLGSYYDKKIIKTMKRQKNKTKIPSGLPSDIEVANKTGEIEKVENDVAIVFTDKGNYIISILTNGDNNDLEKSTIVKLSKGIYETYMDN
ncbi:class A beta-lactamase-related serine hydrolase [Clostridium algidicarnis]|uniref:serine hydrolase n=1 Tax=Clostridium algidicarnis TaxID=37659 RepID=UPI001C0CA870|nr:serine hydrolase [Clostridium algidicarnis]MBU3197496.1 class A beta-lactamase-related serine hydrolase [Clostridium algidicarnis]